MGARAKKLHWTQRPENRAKLQALGRARHAKAAPRPLSVVKTTTLFDEHAALFEKIRQRIGEIDRTMASLKDEHDKLAALLEVHVGDPE